MHQKERIKYITEILEKNGYVTVKYLIEELDYSTATINRDLNAMQNQHLIKRSYGGVELVKNRDISLVFRYNKMRPSKNKIGKKAAELICDGDTIFIDGSTTAQYIGKFITEKKDLTVITNNITLAAFLSEHSIEVICLGGRIFETPSMICSDETAENARKYSADKMFFSSGQASENGKIGYGGPFYPVHKAMMENSREIYFLVDHDKINKPAKQYLGTFDDVCGVISDYRFSDETKQKYKITVFIEVE